MTKSQEKQFSSFIAPTPRGEMLKIGDFLLPLSADRQDLGLRANKKEPNAQRVLIIYICLVYLQL